MVTYANATENPINNTNTDTPPQSYSGQPLILKTNLVVDASPKRRRPFNPNKILNRRKQTTTPLPLSLTTDGRRRPFRPSPVLVDGFLVGNVNSIPQESDRRAETSTAATRTTREAEQTWSWVDGDRRTQMAGLQMEEGHDGDGEMVLPQITVGDLASSPRRPRPTPPLSLLSDGADVFSTWQTSNKNDADSVDAAPDDPANNVVYDPLQTFEEVTAPNGQVLLRVTTVSTSGAATDAPPQHDQHHHESR